jgi:hypothetical protein
MKQTSTFEGSADLLRSIVGEDVFIAELCVLSEAEIKQRYSNEEYVKLLDSFYKVSFQDFFFLFPSLCFTLLLYPTLILLSFPSLCFQLERERVASDECKSFLVPEVNKSYVAGMHSCAEAERFREEQSRHLGVFGHLVATGPDDRVHVTSDKGFSLYWRSAQMGMSFPLSDFVIQLLQLLDIVPSQLTRPAWCHICSFERMFHAYAEFEELTFREPTIGLFLNYYYFFEWESWIGVKRRRGKVFKELSKVLNWSNGFYYLPSSDQDHTSTIRREWKLKDIDDQP